MNATWPLRALSVLLLASPALATDWIIDDDGGVGVDFTDLPAAMATANHTDVLRVRPGTYSGFVSSKGVTIIADTGAELGLSQFIRIEDLASFRTFAISGLAMRQLAFLRCAGKVIVTEMSAPSTGSESFISAIECDDVRVGRCTLSGGTFAPFWARESTVEIVGSTLVGDDGIDDGSNFTESGDAAMRLELGSHGRVMLCELQGGRGADCTSSFGGPCGAGPGGAGVELRDGSTLVMSGDGTNLIRGGGRGFSDDPFNNGSGGPGISLQGASSARVTGVILENGATASPISLFPGSTIDQSGPPDPVLALAGIPMGGQVMTLTAIGPIGANVRIFLGRTPITVFGPPSVPEPLLVQVLRSVPVGQINGNGTLDYNFIIPPNLGPGFLIIAQTELVQFGGQTNRSASVPILLH